MMNGVFYIGATGLEAQQRALSVTANNITNLNTNGFRRSTVRFAELVAPGSADGQLNVSSSHRLMGQGTFALSMDRVMTPGELQPTGDRMDLAIEGDGFIELLGPSGQSLLWRGGALSINEDGYLAGPGGAALRSMISVPTGATELSIASDGRVLALVDGEPMELGLIDIVLPTNIGALESTAEGLYRADGDQLQTVAPGEEGAGRLIQGAVERSNVELSAEMISLMLTQRAFAASAQVVQAGDRLMEITNSLRR